jgi:GTPase involved in cell partitioning and DNA repair
VQVTLYEKQLSYGVHIVRHTYYAAPQATLDAGVQDAAYQALTTLCQELQDLDSQQLSEMEKVYVQKIDDLQAWERVQERKIQVLQALSSAQKAIQSLRVQLRKIGEDVDDDQDDLALDDYDMEDY